MKQEFIIILLIATIGYIQSAVLQPDIEPSILKPIICPEILCYNPACNGNYIVNKNGCTTCECNPCKFGQPLLNIPCGEGQQKCTANNGLCKLSSSDNAYCCPDEHPGCCPPPPFPQNYFCVKSTCQNDTICATGQKCCKPCMTCVNAILS